ncbi:MAG TPA: serine hydrolase, partial [Candidatus Dormibacteraeota bacterium]|nr:serine hydrolase [Candidatus Dormibacteraeota bacterium]
TTPMDMLTLLSLMARGRLIDPWSSRAMLEILERQEIDTLLPEPLPDSITIAHKTGSLHDVMADVGVVYEPGAPFAIAAMTSGLPYPALGRSIVRDASLWSFEQMAQLARWRFAAGITGRLAEIITPEPIESSPDVRYWSGRSFYFVGSGGR